MEKIKTPLIILLVIVVGYLSWQINRQSTALKTALSDTTKAMSLMTGSVHCDNTNRYHTPERYSNKEINYADASRFAQTFFTKTNLDPKKYKHGVFISKRAIDTLFDENSYANGLLCNFAFTGNPLDSINLVFQAYNDGGNHTKIKLANPPLNGPRLLIAFDEGFCPAICGTIQTDSLAVH